MKGKEKCKILKEIRAEIAKANGIEWVTENCTHKGECRGTCPKCESEVRALEREIERRRALGKTVALAGISASMIISTMGCDEILYEEIFPVDGDMVIEDTTTTEPQYDGGMVPEPGEVYMPYHTTDFVAAEDPRHYLINGAIYYETLADITYPEEMPPRLESQMRVSVVGISETNGMYLVKLENEVLVAVYSADLENCAERLPVDDSENSENTENTEKAE